MARVRSANTAPEIAVRKTLHRLGYRYRLGQKALAHTPDVVFKGRKKAIFVHGCFWHGHMNCQRARLPKTRTDFWREKIKKNKIRDRKIIETLNNNGWSCLIIWECSIQKKDGFVDILDTFMSEPTANAVVWEW